MQSLQRMQQVVVEMEYGWTKPQTLVVFVPGVSLFVMHEKFKNLFGKVSERYNSETINEFEKSPLRAKIVDVGWWHLRGALIQIIALSILACLGYYLSFIPLSLACYEVAQSANKASGDFEPKFNGKKIEIS